MASLFQACKAAVRNRQGGTFSIGGYDIDIELYHQQDINDDITYGDIAFGDNDESKIVLVADDTITIPSGYTLTPDKPKKSLVIYCNTLVNNGTISMYQKAPNVLPHDYYIIQGSIINSNRDLVIPAYANNNTSTSSGTNGTNRNCGSGGIGDRSNSYSGQHTTNIYAIAGSGYAFGGGAGSGGIMARNWTQDIASPCSVDTIYPMRGGTPINHDKAFTVLGGVGNPSISTNSTGCGGRVIIFCSSFTNNGTITVNGTVQENIGGTGTSNPVAYGGASGAGAVDLFYTTLVEQGSITANGGTGPFTYNKGGNGSITLTQWNFDKVIKEERKMFTKDNWVYLFTEYTTRLREDVI